MFYLALQILVFLILAVALGFVIGWLLKGVLFREQALASGDAGSQKLRSDLAGAKRESSQHRSAIEQLRGELESARADGKSTADQLRSQLSTSQNECENCRSELSRLQDEVESLRAQLQVLQAQPQQPLLHTTPAAAPDDLKMISGVGPKLEKTLNDLGIYHFRQIAEFTPENVAWVDERLRFKGRIGRERWVEQARDLASGVDTEFGRRYQQTQEQSDDDA